ncbi:exodeoxyribonuclease VII large subunit [Rummeliibacillus suwonensis]|uniref:exodeoxyribonuclease VII large subunit n=1 Tax=Rummeliibacillus suwonensis TaxID=1306154 RepID=UPI0011B632B3|nr:exodeoxyribonuclease VII large subunit [Rummeliibacillus suwonensis]
MTSTPYLTVQALTKYIKKKFDVDPYLRNVYVKGELSNVKHHIGSGHIYFTLKDEKTQIKAVMFASYARQLKFKPESGMKVLIKGDVNVYEGGGQYQLYAQVMEPDGLGSLYLAFEQLKEKLQKEGLFSDQYKKPIPAFPRKVAVVTATTGAAIRDICTTIKQNYKLTDIIIFPALVQGEHAAKSIVKAIEQANRTPEIDTLIVARGGGSIEDLWAFNEEIVARAIFNSVVPVISGVGHETDTTISDLVADVRAATPTAAAKRAVPSSEELAKYLLTRKAQLFQLVQARIKQEKAKLERLQKSYPLAYPDRLYRPFIEKISRMDERLHQSILDYLKHQKLLMTQMDHRLQLRSPLQQLRYEKTRVENNEKSLKKAVLQQLNRRNDEFRSVIRTLEALNPLAIMTRGYSLTYHNGKVIKSIQEVKEHDEVEFHLQDGKATATVTSITVEDKMKL